MSYWRITPSLHHDGRFIHIYLLGPYKSEFVTGRKKKISRFETGWKITKTNLSSLIGG